MPKKTGIAIVAVGAALILSALLLLLYNRYEDAHAGQEAESLLASVEAAISCLLYTSNTFTVGNVKIDLIESKFHRTGSDNSGDTSLPDPTTKAAGMEFIPDGWTIFTDDEIKNDAKTYATDYLAVKGENMVPGRGVAKCPYVINTGANDAYIRVRVMVPSAAVSYTHLQRGTDGKTRPEYHRYHRD